MESGQQSATARPNGPVAAALIAAGIGALVLGLLTTLGSASESVKDWLEWSERVGSLSGKTILSSAAFVVSWIGLGFFLRDRDLPWRPVLIATAVLLALGILGTFPPFFEAFEPE